MKGLIEMYINNMTINDMKHFLEKNNNKVCDKDLEIVLSYAKKYWERIYNGDTSIFEDIKKEISPESYETMINLYDKYKNYLDI